MKELKWYTGTYTYDGDYIPVEKVDDELDSIIKKYNNHFEVFLDLSFEILGWNYFNGDNVEVEFVFNRDFDSEEFGKVEEKLNDELLDNIFGDAKVFGTGWDNKRKVRRWSFCWHKYSINNKDHSIKKPNWLDFHTSSSNINGTEPFNRKESLEISKTVCEKIVDFLKNESAKVYGNPEAEELEISHIKPGQPSWRGSYTHNFGNFYFSACISSYIDDNGRYSFPDENDISELLEKNGAKILNNFLAKYNLEFNPSNTKARWYNGGEATDEETWFEFKIGFKEKDVSPEESYFSHKGNSFKTYYDWEDDPNQNRTFPKRPVNESWEKVFLNILKENK
ncbi:MAG: hypothetical protein HUJ68_04180 [Clostridia bacterium]|nr:hypothetical protein [Clostridia bacterium]